MAFGPPKKPEFGDDKMAFAEDLVRKSLAINPGLRGLDSTHKYLMKMRELALAKPQTKTNEPKAAPAKSAADRRAESTQLFLQQRAGEFDTQLAGIDARLAALEEEKRAAKAQVVDEVVSFMSVVWAEADADTARRVLEGFRPFLTALGVSAVDVVKRAREAR